MVYITGDCHGSWKRFNMEHFPEQRELTREDFVIVCGDFGLWHNDANERQRIGVLKRKPFTILFVDGNHENFDRLYGRKNPVSIAGVRSVENEFPIVDFHGGKAHKIADNIYHLMRGYTFDLCGKKFFTFGGASSHDIKDGILNPLDFETFDKFEEMYFYWTKWGRVFRVNHMSWWEDEMPTEKEMFSGLDNLLKQDFKVDYIITHCAPQHIASILSHGRYKPDALTEYFDKVAEETEFKHWYFGHYHEDHQIMINIQQCIFI